MQWEWVKNNIFKPVANFFSGFAASIRSYFAGTQPHTESQAFHPQETQPLLREVDTNSSSTVITTLNRDNVVQAGHTLNNLRVPVDITLNYLNGMFIQPNRVAIVKNLYKTALFFDLPTEIVSKIASFSSDKTLRNLSLTCKTLNGFFRQELGIRKEIHKAFYHAVRAETKDIAILIEMVKANPELLLQPIEKVTTRGGVEVEGVTLYQFFIGAGDPEAAEQIEPFFANLPDGENERIRQAEPYKAAIEKLKQQVESKESAYDLTPLIQTIIESSDADVEAALNKNMDHESKLNKALKVFRDAILEPKSKKVGELHYEHYTTLQQALDLLEAHWQQTLSNNRTNYNKCDLVWEQVFGLLQLKLSAPERFGFARAFDDKKRTTEYKYGRGSFPDYPGRGVILEPVGLGFDEAILGGVGPLPGAWLNGWYAFGKKHMSSKNCRLGELIQPRPKLRAAV